MRCIYILKTLKKSASLTKDEKDREHVTLHIRKNPEIFSRINFVSPPELFWPELGLTLDEYPDYILIKNIIENFFRKNKSYFTCHEVINYLKKNKSLLKINENILRKGEK